MARGESGKNSASAGLRSSGRGQAALDSRVDEALRASFTEYLGRVPANNEDLASLESLKQELQQRGPVSAQELQRETDRIAQEIARAERRARGPRSYDPDQRRSPLSDQRDSNLNTLERDFARELKQRGLGTPDDYTYRWARGEFAGQAWDASPQEISNKASELAQRWAELEARRQALINPKPKSEEELLD